MTAPEPQAVSPQTIAIPSIKQAFHEAAMRVWQWRSIETAPKDGTLLLLFGSDGPNQEERFVFCGGWNECEGAFWAGSEPHWRGQEMGRYWPTHWMPLPEGPA